MGIRWSSGLTFLKNARCEALYSGLFSAFSPASEIQPQWCKYCARKEFFIFAEIRRSAASFAAVAAFFMVSSSVRFVQESMNVVIIVFCVFFIYSAFRSMINFVESGSS